MRVASHRAAHDAIARFPAAHAFADRGDLTRELGAGPRRSGRRARAQRRAADQFAAIRAGGAHGDDDLTRPGDRDGALAQLEHRAFRAGTADPRLHGLCHRAAGASDAGTSWGSGMRALICSSQPRARTSIISPSGPLYLRLTLVLAGHSVQLAASSVARVSSMSST